MSSDRSASRGSARASASKGSHSSAPIIDSKSTFRHLAIGTLLAVAILIVSTLFAPHLIRSHLPRSLTTLSSRQPSYFSSFSFHGTPHNPSSDPLSSSSSGTVAVDNMASIQKVAVGEKKYAKALGPEKKISAAEEAQWNSCVQSVLSMLEVD
ncbi:hypothetical protein BD324DRAFT_372794 [Kockovaella imperatae]|uniref:Uncharacterized protein n=1 Tax=Kockovaella imperatae TaxID=4999 RepID=A0A1Y1UKQ3_9TREE|nr:hypothetical protein BD324DRAFT_372794 [Kockovaella imperatae]ORX38633.1 hypothetical protein BD324DRAFT_372794 [Kockovaella imperatae]